MLYEFLRFICRPFLKLFFLYKVKNQPNPYPEGRLIICANHKSAFDPVLLVQINNRQIYFMSKKEAFENKILGFLLKKLGTFPVNRGGNDIEAIRQSLKVSNEEKILGIFPEGTRIADEKVSRENFNDGIAMIALKANSNILPIRIRGKYGLFSRPVFEYKEIIDISKFNNPVKKELYKEIIDEVYYSIFDENIKKN